VPTLNRFDDDPLVRLRADPAKIRVSVRRIDQTLFQVVVGENKDKERLAVSLACEATQPAVERTLNELLIDASLTMDGIDLGMHRVYPHPQATKEQVAAFRARYRS
jgi:hypothetical protein